MQTKKHKLASQELFEFAVRSLSRRAQSSGELRTKLRERAASLDDVEPVIARLREYKYLDDERFAENFAAARLENQGFGQARTRNDLRSRRVAPASVDRAVENAYKETDETKLVEDFIRRRYRAANRETLFQQDKDLASAYRRLIRAGFRSTVIVKVLKQFAKNPDLLDFIETETSDPDSSVG